jgi:hypothetical protein
MERGESLEERLRDRNRGSNRRKRYRMDRERSR